MQAKSTAKRGQIECHGTNNHGTLGEMVFFPPISKTLALWAGNAQKREFFVCFMLSFREKQLNNKNEPLPGLFP